MTFRVFLAGPCRLACWARSVRRYAASPNAGRMMQTRKRTQAVAILAGLVALILGVAGTHDVFVGSSNRLLGGPLVVMILLGPALVAVGIVVLLSAGTRSLRTDQSGGRWASLGGGFLKVVGGTLMLASVALLVLGAVTGSEILGFYSTVSLFVLALPGLGLFLVGSFLRPTAQGE